MASVQEAIKQAREAAADAVVIDHEPSNLPATQAPAAPPMTFMPPSMETLAVNSGISKLVETWIKVSEFGINIGTDRTPLFETIKVKINMAENDGFFVKHTIKTRAGEVTVSEDEQPKKGRPDKIPALKPAFAKDGTITAANASSISDGAAALVVTRQSVAAAQGKAPVAKIVAMAAHAHEPAKFTTAPVAAIQKVLDKAGWSAADVDLYEVNEAFACVTMFAMHDLGIPHDKINVHGGATALGHPIGASGARIVTTLIAALKRHGKTRGVASLCIGGGEATAIAIELIA